MRLVDLLGWLPAWREAGWQEITPEQYAETWARFGGSVMTHPQVIERLSFLADIPVRYLGLVEKGLQGAAIATWDGHLALSKDVLKRRGKKRLFDLGNAEIILPVSPAARFELRFRGGFISEKHAAQIGGLIAQQDAMALLRPPEDYRGKFLYNQRRELRKFQEQGGCVESVAGMSPEQLAEIYAHLFFLRWGFEAPGKENLAQVFSQLHEFMMGSVLFVGERPVAIQVLYRVESPEWVSVEYVNGGVDPAFEHLSPGSVLTFLNTQAAWEDARRLGKALRYSFGRADRDYKMRWCSPVPVYRC